MTDKDIVKGILDNALTNCTEGSNYAVCRPVIEDTTKIAQQIDAHYQERYKGWKSPKELEPILKDLWDNDDDVPTVANYRCSELNWFSSGIKDNVVASIAVTLLGKEQAEKLLEERLDADSLKKILEAE